jgi:putative ABC transport system permease protein
VKDAALNDTAVANQYQTYYSLYQDPDRWVALNYPEASIVVRTPLDAATLIPAIKATVYQAGNEQPVYHVQTMRQIVADSMSEQRFPMILLGTFAGLALLLAAVGIYGMISYSVTQRVQEIGIRMALGADRRSIFRMIVYQAMQMAGAGLLVGILAAIALVRLLSSFSHLLYGVNQWDPLTLSGVSAVLLIAALAACYVPAQRAMRTDPMDCLRTE